MRILLTGATGFIGQRLGQALVENGHTIVAPVRNPQRARTQLPFPCELYKWDKILEPLPPDILKGIEAVIHLVGEPVAEGRWTEAKKRRIKDSRILGTRLLVDGLRAHSMKLKIFVSASAVGFYGFHDNEILDETAVAGTDFLAEVTKGWEEEALKAEEINGARVVCLRTGIVLGAEGGALVKLIPVFKAGIGGKLGTGEQWMSWIHIDDMVRLYLFALENENLNGPINAVAPNPVKNKEFTSEFARALGTNTFLPIPGLALHAAFGELAQVLLRGARVSSGKAEKLGFKFRFTDLGPAMEDLVGEMKNGYQLVEYLQWVAAPLDKVFDFFSDEKNLETLTPPFLKFAVQGISTPKIGEGTVIDYKLKIHGLPLSWKSKIEDWQPDKRFVDEQLKGPYESWRHNHEFSSLAGGTLIRDRIRYRLPMGVLGRMIGGMKVAADVDAIFAFRRSTIEQIFS